MPSEYSPPLRLDTPAWLLVPRRASALGASYKEWPEEGVPVMCEWRTYGGTEAERNGALVVEDTATVRLWYDPRIASGCRLRLESGAEYEVLGEPEDVAMRHQHMRLKVRRVKGGA